MDSRRGPAFRLLLTALLATGAIVLPYAVMAGWLVLSRLNLDEETQEVFDLVFLFVSLMPGLLCLFSAPISTVGRVALSAIYAPIMLLTQVSFAKQFLEWLERITL